MINVASAHHPFSVNYDATKFGSLTGKLAAVQWSNPHGVLVLDVESDAKTERWMIEGTAPNALLRRWAEWGLLEVQQRPLRKLDPVDRKVERFNRFAPRFWPGSG